MQAKWLCVLATFTLPLVETVYAAPDNNAVQTCAVPNTRFPQLILFSNQSLYRTINEGMKALQGDISPTLNVKKRTVADYLTTEGGMAQAGMCLNFLSIARLYWSRIGITGVPGFLLGEGMSFISKEHGKCNEGDDKVRRRNFRFHAFSMLADLGAMLPVHDTIFWFTQERGPNIVGFVSTLAMSAVTKSYVTVNRGEDPLGDPMGIDTDFAHYLFCEETLSWLL
ncbi:hypothetical protein GGR58DRAFT_500987 [Xylaria digitata]|nr:hypothetical protein GGR58DRAFT_500987 [Xylaria digitata]